MAIHALWNKKIITAFLLLTNSLLGVQGQNQTCILCSQEGSYYYNCTEDEQKKIMHCVLNNCGTERQYCTVDNNPRSLYNEYGDRIRTNATELKLSKIRSFHQIKHFIQMFPKIEILDLSGNKMKNCKENDFHGLNDLREVNYKGNQGIQSRAFFRSLPKSLLVFKTSKRYDCCHIKDVRPLCNCSGPTEHQLSHCDSLIKNDKLRYFMRVVVVLIFGGNIFTLVMRLLLPDSEKVQNLLICSLCISDMLMGVYLAGITYKDITTRNEYRKEEITWRTGRACNALGAISVISSEVSVFTLVFIAYDRYLYVVHGLQFKRLGYRTAVVLLVMTWIVSSLLAFLPAVTQLKYFYDAEWISFYGSNGLCMPLQLGAHSVATYYCVALFGVINCLAALALILLYLRIFYSFYTSQEPANVVVKRDRNRLAKRFAVIVLTDVCCWIPVASLLFASLKSGKKYHKLYYWFSICVIPINSAINPLLYTLSSPVFWNWTKERFKKAYMKCRNGRWWKRNTNA